MNASGGGIRLEVHGGCTVKFSDVKIAKTEWKETFMGILVVKAIVVLLLGAPSESRAGWPHDLDREALFALATSPLSRDARTLVEDVIPERLPALIRKERNGTISGDEQARLDSYLRILSVKDRYDFLTHLLTVARHENEQSLEHRFGLFKTAAVALPSRRFVTLEGKPVPPEVVLLAGNVAYLVRDSEGRILPPQALLRMALRDASEIERFALGAESPNPRNATRVPS